ncbi:MAG: hypothetical protein SF097_18080 [Acidobacteriota bacterium]|nr:hypothetical protein [Acidobacteriota bacterium]
MLSDYRQRFSEYHSELHREDFLFRSGRQTSRDVSHIHSEYSDLFRLSTVEELRAKFNDVSESRKTERAAIGRLIAFALEGNLLARVREVSSEIAEYEAASKIDWEGERIVFHQIEELLATEPDRQRRRELHARRADIVKGTQDLLAERFEKLRIGAVELGFESYTMMRRQLRGVDLETVATKATQFLSKTESRYVSELAPLLARETGVALDEATVADLPYLRRYTRFDVFFPREQMLRVYRELFAGFGFNPDKQTNVELDAAVRAGKQRRAFCSPIRIPDEIKLVVQPTGGQLNYGEFLRAAGKAQSAAWTSRNLPPEFQRGGGAAVPMAWTLLIENLLLEEAWLTGTFGFVANAEFRRALSLFRLLDLRREAARLTYELEFHSGNLTSGIGERYAELMTDALRVRVDGADCLSDLSDDFRSADFLRAAAFEAQLRDYLKTQFGSRWWTSAKAGEMLIDLWNTGQQYSVEELAAMIGLGELDFDSLISGKGNYLA